MTMPELTEAAVEAAEPDPYGELEQWGMTFALKQFAAGLGVEKWEGGDGSESVEGDIWAEFDNIAKAGGFVTPDGDTFLNMGPDALRSALAAIPLLSPSMGWGTIDALRKLTRWQTIKMVGDEFVWEPRPNGGWVRFDELAAILDLLLPANGEGR